MATERRGSFSVRFRARHASEVVASRIRLGARRSRNNAGHLVQVALGATVAYSICHFLLGHPYPFLAAVAATVGIGVTSDRRLRRSLEFGFGATFGVLAGDLMVSVFGTGIWQLFVVLLTAQVIGTILNSGGLFVTQVGIQSIYVVTVPSFASSAPFDRTIDALIGASTAILLALIVPHDARKTPRRRAATLLDEIATVLAESADALARADAEAARRALNRSRGSQGMVDSWRMSLRISQEEARINARSRRYAAEVGRLARACEYADRSMRMVSVIARRVAGMADRGVAKPELAQRIHELSSGARRLKVAFQRGTSRVPAEEYMRRVVGLLTVDTDVQDLDDRTLLVLLRPLGVDLLQVTGMTESEARACLPHLDTGAIDE